MAYVETCKHRGPHVGPCTECMKEKIASLAAERDALREEVDKYNFRVSYKCPECGAYHLAPDVKGDEIKALKARLALADKLAEEAGKVKKLMPPHSMVPWAAWYCACESLCAALSAYRKG